MIGEGTCPEQIVEDTVAIVPTVVILFSTNVKVVLAVQPEGPVTITPTTELSDTVIMQNCEIGSYSSLKGTIIGDNSSIGSHVVAIPMTRDILYFDQTFSVSDRGAMIGDDCNIGSRAILQGGSILMSKSTVGEGEFYNADFQGDSI